MGVGRVICMAASECTSHGSTPSSSNAFLIRRAGRSAECPSFEGLAVLRVLDIRDGTEASAYLVDGSSGDELDLVLGAVFVLSEEAESSPEDVPANKLNFLRFLADC